MTIRTKLVVMQLVTAFAVLVSASGMLFLDQVKLPAALLAGLRAAAEAHSITDLNRHLDALEKTGPEGQALAPHLRERSRHFDLESVRRILRGLDAE